MECLLISIKYADKRLLVESSKFYIRQHHPVVVLKEKSGSTVCLGSSGLMEQKKKKGLGCSSHMLQRNSRFPRRCNHNNKGGWTWGSEGEGDFALETEILEFMDCSENPNKFPTKNDLINPGRDDLVEAIEKNRHWLWKMGWDLDEEEEKEIEIVDLLNSTDIPLDLSGIIACEDSSSSAAAAAPSSSGREMEKEEEEECVKEEDVAGIDGILKRLEKERNLSFGLGFTEKKTDDLSCKTDYEDYWKLENSSMYSDSKHLKLELVSTLRQLMLELASTLRSLESVSEIDTSSFKGSDSPLDKFLELSDAWEFQETDVMNAKNKLRSIRAMLAILEGKIVLAAIESQKILEMKQKRINDAQLALISLPSAWIVRPNNGLVVLVCRSSDDWVSQALQKIWIKKISSDFISLVPSPKGSSYSEATDFGEASDKNCIWETLVLSLKNIWVGYLKMQSKTETALATVVTNLGNCWQSLVESNRLEHEDRMKTIFPGFNLDQEEEFRQSTMFMSEFEEKYFNSVSRTSKLVVGAIRGPLLRLIVMLVTPLLFVVRLVFLTLIAILGQIFLMGQNH